VDGKILFLYQNGANLILEYPRAKCKTAEKIGRLNFAYFKVIITLILQNGK
jgi:hypothetical protein